MSFLQIACWNIENLSGNKRYHKQSAYALTDHIEMAGVDLIALQEIYLTPLDEEVRLFDDQPLIDSRAVTDLRNSDLDIVCFLLEELLQSSWKYIILPNRRADDDSQLCAVLWNASRLTIGDVIPLDVSFRNFNLRLWERWPHVLQFSSEFGVWRRSATGAWEKQAEKRTLSIVPLHMKSNTDGASKGRRVRAKEAETLCEALEKVKDAIDPSLILLGDTNILRNDEQAIDIFVDHGFIDLNESDAATYWSRQYGESPFDRIFVPAGREEFKYSRQYVLRSSDLSIHDRFLSDHFMIKTSVKNYIDDADPR